MPPRIDAKGPEALPVTGDAQESVSLSQAAPVQPSSHASLAGLAGLPHEPSQLRKNPDRKLLEQAAQRENIFAENTPKLKHEARHSDGLEEIENFWRIALASDEGREMHRIIRECIVRPNIDVTATCERPLVQNTPADANMIGHFMPRKFVKSHTPAIPRVSSPFSLTRNPESYPEQVIEKISGEHSSTSEVPNNCVNAVPVDSRVTTSHNCESHSLSEALSKPKASSEEPSKSEEGQWSSHSWDEA